MTGESILRIESRTTGGGTSAAEAGGRCYEKNGYHYVLFEVEGDSCRIKFNAKSLEYRRSGELSYRLRFVPGEETAADMTTAYGVTGITCRTHMYNEIIKEDEMVLNLSYNVADEDCDMRITIRKKDPDQRVVPESGPDA